MASAADEGAAAAAVAALALEAAVDLEEESRHGVARVAPIVGLALDRARGRGEPEWAVPVAVSELALAQARVAPALAGRKAA